jgi:hypothetical protein
MDTEVLNDSSNVQTFGGSHEREDSSAPIHRNSPEEWLALSEDHFKAAVLERAKHARNSEERYSWEEVKAYAHSQRTSF